MINTLQWDKGAVDSMEYIGIVESLYLPDVEDYDYKINVDLCDASQEEVDDIRNIPFGATSCMVIFKNRYNTNSFTKKLSYTEFVQNYTIKQLVKELGLDIDKFWLLVLFCLDYCDSLFYQGTAMKLNPVEQLRLLVDNIRIAPEGEMSLSFKSSKSKANLDDTRAIHFIANAIENALREANYDTLRYLSGRIENENAKEYIIDDAELERVKANYPMIWKDANAKPKLCFMGCPHMSLQQLKDWTDRVEAGLKEAGNSKVVIPTVFTASPGVLKEFEKTPYAERLKATGVITSYICPLMYMNNPLCAKMPVITSSNKLRTYTTARYYTDDEILEQITKGGKQ
jgi:hypothetical protein